MTFGDAQTGVLPIGPKRLPALGPNNLAGTIPPAAVDDLDTVRIRAAARYVRMAPRQRTGRWETISRAVRDAQRP